MKPHGIIAFVALLFAGAILSGSARAQDQKPLVWGAVYESLNIGLVITGAVYNQPSEEAAMNAAFTACETKSGTKHCFVSIATSDKWLVMVYCAHPSPQFPGKWRERMSVGSAVKREDATLAAIKSATYDGITAQADCRPILSMRPDGSNLPPQKQATLKKK